MKQLGELVTVKKVREETADRAVRTQRRRLDEAVQDLDSAEQRLREYRDYAIQEERRIYRGLCERVVRLRDIENVQAQVMFMRGRERDHADARDESQKRRDGEQLRLDANRAVHREAMRARDKFIEIADTFSREQRLEAEGREEAEIEEAAQTRRPPAAALEATA